MFAKGFGRLSKGKARVPALNLKHWQRRWLAKTQQYVFLGITKVAPMPSLVAWSSSKGWFKRIHCSVLRREWSNTGKTKCSWDVSWVCLLLRFPPHGALPRFCQLCARGRSRNGWWDWGQTRRDKLGLGRSSARFCLLVKQMRVRSLSTNQTVMLAQGMPCSPPTPWGAGDKALALVRLPGKKLYTEEEIIFHPPWVSWFLAVFSVWDLRICRQTNSTTQQRSV